MDNVEIIEYAFQLNPRFGLEELQRLKNDTMYRLSRDLIERFEPNEIYTIKLHPWVKYKQMNQWDDPSFYILCELGVAQRMDPVIYNTPWENPMAHIAPAVAVGSGRPENAKRNASLYFDSNNNAMYSWDHNNSEWWIIQDPDKRPESKNCIIRWSDRIHEWIFSC